ncbi:MULTISPECIES: hypothetical protein [unclassified Bacillus (in: firmicutes)]|nr:MULTISPECIES: hypothetical protein [unclassified Bacillus (in: firmicutes)]
MNKENDHVKKPEFQETIYIKRLGTVTSQGKFNNKAYVQKQVFYWQCE